jgi:hypothetical protein
VERFGLSVRVLKDRSAIGTKTDRIDQKDRIATEMKKGWIATGTIALTATERINQNQQMSPGHVLQIARTVPTTRMQWLRAISRRAGAGAGFADVAAPAMGTEAATSRLRMQRMAIQAILGVEIHPRLKAEKAFARVQSPDSTASYRR